jgi:hypothetical protein
MKAAPVGLDKAYSWDWLIVINDAREFMPDATLCERKWAETM